MDTTVRSLHLGYRFRTPVTDLSNTTRGRSHMLIDRIWPPYALRLQCADMELSPVRDADLPELAEIARNGVRRDGVQAFLVDWDTGRPEQIARSLAQYHWATRAGLSVEKWTIEFTVRVADR